MMTFTALNARLLPDGTAAGDIDRFDTERRG